MVIAKVVARAIEAACSCVRLALWPAVASRAPGSQPAILQLAGLGGVGVRSALPRSLSAAAGSLSVARERPCQVALPPVRYPRSGFS